MKKLFDENEVLFAVAFIVVYVVGSSVADSLAPDKSVTLLFDLVLSTVIIVFIAANGLWKYYGLRLPSARAEEFLYYIPLIILASVNLWGGIKINLGFKESLLYILSMLLVGFIEEMIFRGFLFRGMARDGVKPAIIVTSITFGIGHIVNLINGSGAGFTENLCQVAYAIALGFMLVTIVYKGGSLLPCIAMHGVLNALSVFGNTEKMRTVPVSVAIVIIAVGYSVYLWRMLPESQKYNIDKMI